MGAILTIKNMNTGDVLKQGDDTVLKYQLLDANDEELDLVGKSGRAVLMNDGKIYYSADITIEEENIAKFSIKDVLPVLSYDLEIIVEVENGEFIFPSINTEKIIIEQSSVGMTTEAISALNEEELIQKLINVNNAIEHVTINEWELYDQPPDEAFWAAMSDKIKNQYNQEGWRIQIVTKPGSYMIYGNSFRAGDFGDDAGIDNGIAYFNGEQGYAELYDETQFLLDTQDTREGALRIYNSDMPEEKKRKRGIATFTEEELSENELIFFILHDGSAEPIKVEHLAEKSVTMREKHEQDFKMLNTCYHDQFIRMGQTYTMPNLPSFANLIAIPITKIGEYIVSGSIVKNSLPETTWDNYLANITNDLRAYLFAFNQSGEEITESRVRKMLQVWETRNVTQRYKLLYKDSGNGLNVDAYGFATGSFYIQQKDFDRWDHIVVLLEPEPDGLYPPELCRVTKKEVSLQEKFSEVFIDTYSDDPRVKVQEIEARLQEIEAKIEEEP